MALRWTVMAPCFALIAACANADSKPGGDPAFGVDGTISIPAAAGTLDATPTVIQVFEESDFDSLGAIHSGAKPFFAFRAHGPLSSSVPLAFDNGGIGCARPQFRVFGWVDVDGSSLGASEYDALPSAGDLRTPFMKSSSPRDACSPGLVHFDQVADAIVDGEAAPRTAIGVIIDPGIVLIQQATVDAYAPEDLAGGAPCASCSPLFSFGKTTTESPKDSSSETGSVLSADRFAVPMRLWAHAETTNGVFHGASKEVLFAGEAGIRSRAAVGVAITLAPE